MKQNIKKLFFRFGYVFYILFPPFIIRRINLLLNQIYTIWKAHDFKKSSKNVSFQYPMYLHGGKYISIGDNFNCGQRLRIEAFDKHLGYSFTPKIIIGDHVSINHDCHIGAIGEIIIEDHVLIASKVFITDHYHGEITSAGIQLPPSERKLFSKGGIKIEKNVWVGEGVVILPNVTIGANSILGANAVITKDIPKNSVVGGNPARIIKTL